MLFAVYILHNCEIRYLPIFIAAHFLHLFSSTNTLICLLSSLATSVSYRLLSPKALTDYLLPTKERKQLNNTFLLQLPVTQFIWRNIRKYSQNFNYRVENTHVFVSVYMREENKTTARLSILVLVFCHITNVLCSRPDCIYG